MGHPRVLQREQVESIGLKPNRLQKTLSRLAPKSEHKLEHGFDLALELNLTIGFDFVLGLLLKLELESEAILHLNLYLNLELSSNLLGAKGKCRLCPGLSFLLRFHADAVLLLLLLLLLLHTITPNQLSHCKMVVCSTHTGIMHMPCDGWHKRTLSSCQQRSKDGYMSRIIYWRRTLQACLVCQNHTLHVCWFTWIVYQVQHETWWSHISATESCRLWEVECELHHDGMYLVM